VLLKEKHAKASDYPMGRVRSIVTNDIDEVTGATVLKGRTGELVNRHVNSLIYLFSPPDVEDCERHAVDTVAVDSGNTEHQRPVRAAAVACRDKIAQLKQSDCI